MVVNIGIIKIGNIGVSPIIDVLLDERADREDIDVKAFSTGSKMSTKQVESVNRYLDLTDFDLTLFVSPNPNAKMPQKVIKKLSNIDTHVVVIGDGPGIKAVETMEEDGFGYIIIDADPMIGARREFLDPTEMVIFNSDVMKVLSITGVFRLIQYKLDEVITSIKEERQVELPQIIVTPEVAVEYAGFQNEYAKSKAISAYKLASKVSDMNIKACFCLDDPEEYLPLVSASHDVMSQAANLASEARQIEKVNDTILRTPHKKDGSIISKNTL